MERVLITVSQHCLALLENRVSGTLHFGFVIPLFCFLFGKFLLSGHYYPTKGLIVVQKCYFGSTEAYVIWSLKNMIPSAHTVYSYRIESAFPLVKGKEGIFLTTQKAELWIMTPKQT